MSEVGRRSHQAIGDFAQMLGLPAQANADGSFCFEFERSGLLTFSGAEDGARLVIGLARRKPHSDVDFETRILAGAGFDSAAQFLIHGGLSEDGYVVFAVGIDDRQANLPILDAAVRCLMSAHDELR